MRIRFERLFRDGFLVTDIDRPWRTLTVYRDRDPRAYDALRELELCMADVTPARERHLHGIVRDTWALREELFGRPALSPPRPAA